MGIWMEDVMKSAICSTYKRVEQNASVEVECNK